MFPGSVVLAIAWKRKALLPGLAQGYRLGLSPGLRQTVKTRFALRWNCLVLRAFFLASCASAGKAEAGFAGAQPAEE